MRGAGRRVGLAQQRDQLRAPRVGDPGLSPVDHVMVAVTARGGADGLQVRAAARLGQRHGGPDLPGAHARQIALLLLIGAVVEEQLGHHGVAAHRTGQAHPAAGQFLGDQRITRRADPGRAPRLRDGQAEDAELLHLPDELARVGVVVLELAGDRLDVAVHELADQVHDRPLVLGQLIHESSSRSGVPGWRPAQPPHQQYSRSSCAAWPRSAGRGRPAARPRSRSAWPGADPGTAGAAATRVGTAGSPR